MTPPLSSQPTPPLTPWLSLWIRPRQTIQRIVDEDPGRQVLLIAALLGVQMGFSYSMAYSAGDHLSYRNLLLFIAFGAPLLGIALYCAMAYSLGLTARLFGGQAGFRPTLAALSWGNMPAIWALPLWLLPLGELGPQLFTSAKPLIEATPALNLTLLPVLLAQFLTGLWALYTLMQCVAQVQGIKVWQAFLSFIFASLLLGAPVGILAQLLLTLSGIPLPK